jgi:monothiol glutaredoxin
VHVAAHSRAAEEPSTMTQPDVQKYLAHLVANHRVVLFMKGNKTFPQCGFSAAVVEVLKRHGVAFETINVLQDQAVREGIKQFSSWPTIPQLYIGGEFIGGCDIVREMDASGELADKLRAPGDQTPRPSGPDQPAN